MYTDDGMGYDTTMNKRTVLKTKYAITEMPDIVVAPSALALDAIQLNRTTKRAPADRRRKSRAGAKRAAIRQEW